VKAAIKDKDIMLMIGTTGSGKTTCILRFLGYKLKKVKSNDLTTLAPTTKVAK
jgi:Tfp pilus assembly ATPase PilU